MKKLTEDFEARFRAGDTPWEDPRPWPGLEPLLARFVAPGARVLDVGCGLGTNAFHLVALGYQVLGIDVSPTAIAGACAKRDAAGLACELRVADFLADDCGRHDVVLDRGCLHGFADAEGRRSFARAARRSLVPGGLWIDVSGSADNGDLPEEVLAHGLPRLSLRDLALAAEEDFEAVEIRPGRYGTTPETDFRAWIAVFRRRSG